MSDSSQAQRAPLNPYLVLVIAALAPGSGHWAVGQIQRGVMFAWALWLANSLVGWLKWAWREFSAVGVWKA